MKRWFVAGFLAVLALAAALRLPELALRPLHNDEAVNAIKFRSLWNGNKYVYDPNEFHGPTLPYFTLPFALLNSSRDFNDFSEATYRTVTVAFGLGLIALLLLLTRDLGRTAVGWAACLTALSPAMVFYSRYYIHEMLLAFFTALTALGWWKFAVSKKWAWAVVAGVGLGLMAATKETFVFAVLSMGLAVVSNAVWTRKFMPPDKRLVAGVALSGAVAALVAVFFFSSFFTNPKGIADAVRTYTPWLHRAEGVSPHAHPWYFYFQRLLFFHPADSPVWTEAFIYGLAGLGFCAAMTGRYLDGTNATLARLVAFYSVWLTLIYTFLPYKTTWCLLGFYDGTIVLAGLGAAAALRWCASRPLRIVVIGLLVGGSAHLGFQAWRASFGTDKGGVPFCDSTKNPYAYSQTSPDVLRLTQTVDALARVAPTGYDTVVEVMAPDSYWPLPWYLRRFSRVGYWDKIPDQPLAPLMIVSAGLHAAFDERPQHSHLMAGYFELRPGNFYELYVDVALWTKYVKTLPPEKD